MDDKVFINDLAKDIYIIYPQLAQDSDFAGKKTVDMANYIAEHLTDKGYMRPDLNWALEQTWQMVTSRIADFIHNHMTSDNKFDVNLLTKAEKKEFDELWATRDTLDKLKNEMNK